jgi:hypothetical protein
MNCVDREGPRAPPQQRAAGWCEAARNPREITLEQEAERQSSRPSRSSPLQEGALLDARKDAAFFGGKEEWYREALAFASLEAKAFLFY